MSFIRVLHDGQAREERKEVVCTDLIRFKEGGVWMGYKGEV